MKTKILSLLVAAMIIFNVSYAGNTGNVINENVLTSFTQQFANASNVEWTKTQNYVKATFTWNDQYLMAFYNEEGESIAVSRNILPRELPIALQTSMNEDYKGYWTTELFEYTTTDSNKYYLTLENSDKKIILQSVDNSIWSVFKKTNKE